MPNNVLPKQAAVIFPMGIFRPLYFGYIQEVRRSCERCSVN